MHCGPSLLNGLRALAVPVCPSAFLQTQNLSILGGLFLFLATTDGQQHIQGRRQKMEKME